MVTNATGAYGLAISEWMLAMWLGIQKDMFLYRDRQNQRQWAPIDRPVRGTPTGLSEPLYRKCCRSE